MSEPPANVPYKSDRWITPGVVVTLILAVLIGLLGVVSTAGLLTYYGKDPGPMFDFVATSLGSLTGAASLVLQLANRKTVTKTERNTGVQAGHLATLADAMYDVADALPRPVPRHAYDQTEHLDMRAAPAPRGS